MRGMPRQQLLLYNLPISEKFRHSFEYNGKTHHRVISKQTARRSSARIKDVLYPLSCRITCNVDCKSVIALTHHVPVPVLTRPKLGALARLNLAHPRTQRYLVETRVAVQRSAPLPLKWLVRCHARPGSS